MLQFSVIIVRVMCSWRKTSWNRLPVRILLIFPLEELSKKTYRMFNSTEETVENFQAERETGSNDQEIHKFEKTGWNKNLFNDWNWQAMECYSGNQEISLQFSKNGWNRFTEESEKSNRFQFLNWILNSVMIIFSSSSLEMSCWKLMELFETDFKS